jgi:hypothetical protein
LLNYYVSPNGYCLKIFACGRLPGIEKAITVDHHSPLEQLATAPSSNRVATAAAGLDLRDGIETEA